MGKKKNTHIKTVFLLNLELVLELLYMYSSNYQTQGGPREAGELKNSIITERNIVLNLVIW